ncbi:hypothetical protein N7462_000097 [Penicillium macrosclerotiorum]|uniref:uncharacterized protein n=1 Tax=Penicillium macrosclerotiorum TaxID=303699 RepID=UPI002547A606|nr:uncharacterized protein N7462_000097 [Penicillium macrosclerotiorum]KAJ5698092.1 hypothetical protein N7462_000097 [Penicillium macrosclerotiorum]
MPPIRKPKRLPPYHFSGEIFIKARYLEIALLLAAIATIATFFAILNCSTGYMIGLIVVCIVNVLWCFFCVVRYFDNQLTFVHMILIDLSFLTPLAILCALFGQKIWWFSCKNPKSGGDLHVRRSGHFFSKRQVLSTTDFMEHSELTCWATRVIWIFYVLLACAIFFGIMLSMSLNRQKKDDPNAGEPVMEQGGGMDDMGGFS